MPGVTEPLCDQEKPGWEGGVAGESVIPWGMADSSPLQEAPPGTLPSGPEAKGCLSLGIWQSALTSPIGWDLPERTRGPSCSPAHPRLCRDPSKWVTMDSADCPDARPWRGLLWQVEKAAGRPEASSATAGGGGATVSSD